MADTTEIWTNDDVRNFLDDERPYLRKWALGWLGNRLDDEELEPIAAMLVRDDDQTVAFRAFDVLERVASEPHIDAVRDLLDRPNLEEGAEENVLALLASFGDDEAAETMFERLDDDWQFRWHTWVRRDPEGLAESALAHFGDETLPRKPDFLVALIQTQVPKAVPKLIEAGAAIDEEAHRAQFLDTLLRHAGGALPSFPTPESLTWYGAADTGEDEMTLPFLLADETMEEYSEKLKSCIEQSGYEGFVDGIFEIYDLALENGFDDFESPESAYVRAIAESFREHADDLGKARFQVRIAYGLLLALTQSVGIEEALDDEPGFGTKLALWDNAIGTDKSRTADLVRESWTGSDGDDLFDWLHDYVNTAHRIDKLDLAISLGDVDLSSEAESILDTERDSLLQLLQQDPFAKETAIDLLIHETEVLRERAVALLTDEKVPLDVPLEALSQMNARWACDTLVDNLDAILRRRRGHDVWDAISTLGDPDLLEPVADEWFPDEISIARCARLLAALGGRLDELPDEMLDELDEVEREGAEMGERLQSIAEKGGNFFDYINEEPLPLVMRCEDCERTYRYVVERIFIDMDQMMEYGDADAIAENFDELIEFDQPIACKHCGTEEKFELSRMTRTMLMMSLRQMMASGNPREMTDGRIVPKFSQPQGSAAPDDDSGSTYVESDSKPGRNDPCPCGSGRKYKHCCMRK